MSKPLAYALIALVLFLVSFGTWQLFRGNFGAAFSTLPVLVMFYLYMTYRKK